MSICVDSVLVVKYSTEGILRWVRTYGPVLPANPYASEGRMITADQYGSVYIGGGTSVSGYRVYLTLKCDRNGVWQWGTIYDPPGGGSKFLNAIAMDRNHNALFVSGYAYVNNAWTAATIKYNAATGDSVWVRTGTGTSGIGNAWDVKADSAGSAYITGGIQGSSSVDVATLKYSPQGDEVWLITYNGPFNLADVGRALQLYNPPDIYVLAYSQSSQTVTDYVTIKYSQLLGNQPTSNEFPARFELFQNYPNPFNQLTIISYQLPIRGLVELKLYDILGREVETIVEQEKGAGEYQASFDALNYSSGLYFYRMIVDGNIIDTKKLIIAK